MKKKLLFIYNPKSGKGNIKNHLSDIVDVFAKENYEIIIHPTQYAGEAVEVVRNQPEIDLVVCSGGDGTLDEVVTGMMKREDKHPIGYIPAGSTNDFAASLKIPKNMKKAAITAVQGTSFACDIGAFDDDFFVYIAAFGIFTEVSYETDQQMKNMLGHLAYVLEGAIRLPQTKSYHMKFTANGETIEGDFMFGMVTNSRSVGGVTNITGKNVELDDGVFEVMLIKTPKNPLELNLILSSLVLEKINTDLIYCFKTDRIDFMSTEEVPWTLDGEFGGRKTAVTIKNEHKALEIKVKKKPS